MAHVELKEYRAAKRRLLEAMDMFGQMDAARVMEITQEITLLGHSGLDYASSEGKYTLESLPRKRFSGLQLMCRL